MKQRGEIRAGLLSFIPSVIRSFGLQYYVVSTAQGKLMCYVPCDGCGSLFSRIDIERDMLWVEATNAICVMKASYFFLAVKNTSLTFPRYKFLDVKASGAHVRRPSKLNVAAG